MNAHIKAAIRYDAALDLAAKITGTNIPSVNFEYIQSHIPSLVPALSGLPCPEYAAIDEKLL